MKRFFILMVSILFLTGCGGGMFTKSPAKDEDNNQSGNEDISYSTPWGEVVITRDAFIFGSDYPSDIVIPDIEGMRNTAFVVSYASPSGVIAIDLDSNPLAVSSEYKGLNLPDGTGFPNTLSVLNPRRAFLLTSSHIIDFNPTNGTVNQAINLLETYRFTRPRELSDEYDIDGDNELDSSVQEIEMSYPGGIAISGDKLFVSMSNYINPVSPAIAGPGMVRIFRLYDSDPFIKEESNPIITSDFNPTALTTLSNGNVAVTNSGVSDIWDGVSHPLTESSIELIDHVGEVITQRISLGIVSASFKELAVMDNNLAYLGSSSFGEVYVVDLTTGEALYTHENPVIISGTEEGSDYLTGLAISHDDHYLFVSSFDSSSITPVDISTFPPVVTPETFPEKFVVGFPKGVTSENPTGTNTGIGDVAVRPGLPGIDFTGPDLFALTGNPGTLVTINTYGDSDAPAIQIKSAEIKVEQDNVSLSDTNVQLYLNMEFSDGSREEHITDSFINPYSGHLTNVHWSSKDREIATVDANGLLTPRYVGTTYVSVSIGQTQVEEEIIVTHGMIPDFSHIYDNDDTSSIDPGIILSVTEPAHNTNLEILGVFINYLERWQNSENDDDIEILTEAPDGTDPFVDNVVSFNPGSNAGFGADKMPDIVLGPPHGKGGGAGGLDVVSLGSGGEIILEMSDFLIADGEGVDFIVFENAFTNWYEPATVAVSSEGETFHEFPCDQDGNLAGCAGTHPVFSNPDNGIDPTDPAVSGGDAYDLRDIGLNNARYIKITDIGNEGLGGNSAGFDLDAISVVNGILPH